MFVTKFGSWVTRFQSELCNSFVTYLYFKNTNV